MTFDPFGDFDTQGYLRNFEKEKDLGIVRRLEHTSFTTGLPEAFAHLAQVDLIQYDHVLDTHRILFDAIYPWAGEDRMQTAPLLAVSKAGVLFAHPADIRSAVDYALEHGQDRDFMAARAGEVMGYLAYGHPFLDGNGRTIMVIHSVLSQRAGFSINWAKTDKTEYLRALTKELETPGKGILDGYLQAFIGKPIAYERLGDIVLQTPGLASNVEDTNVVAGSASEPELQAQYEQQRTMRTSG
ncbi:Fic/DOC family protein [Rhodopseudomonas palustris]|uniref:Fic/DOC family protein n=1 Tax=Rhodopseudomonas palustris TaxID=1076 RepID=UPI000E5A4B96|nr:Fic family protein [Rhodopseudomonas palustris]QLH72843.1 Fic family protein [Rhodopseudomonas palustris]RHZ99905.1 cell filamentation protein Fic [Rhodopseudomonas palustris]